jgi:hypothetical protein
MNYARFHFFNPIRFFADVDDSLDPHVSSAQQPKSLLAAGLSLRIRALPAEMELVLAQNIPVSLYPAFLLRSRRQLKSRITGKDIYLPYPRVTAFAQLTPLIQSLPRGN